MRIKHGLLYISIGIKQSVFCSRKEEPMLEVMLEMIQEPIWILILGGYTLWVILDIWMRKNGIL